MKRYLIRLGDKTTAGGVVTEGDSTSMHHGIPLAYHGAEIYCHACKSVGHIVNVPPFRPMTILGKQVALENDICICECDPPPTLIATQHDSSMSFEPREIATGSLYSGGSATVGSVVPADVREAFDEQFLLRDSRGNPLKDIHYTIRLPSGELRHGITDAHGCTGRYQTGGKQKVSVHLGHNRQR